MARTVAARHYYCQVANESPSQSVDVLIIGGGIAACAAALEAAKPGVQVLMVDKGIVGRSGSSPTAGAGTAVYFPALEPMPGSEPDSSELFFRNLVENGEYVNDPNLVRLFVEEAPRRVLDTADMGIQYVRTPEGRIRQHRTMGHTRPRSVTPVGMSRLLLAALRRELIHRGVRLSERTAITRLLTEHGRVTGAVALDVDSGEVRVFRAPSVVLAGGSATGLFKYQSASFLTTGDAWVLGYEVGARLANMEFMEFTIIPKVGRTILPSSGISPYLAFGGKLYDRYGERILQRYDPVRMETTSRATIAFAVYSEWQAERGPVTNDPADFGEEQWNEIRDITQRLESAGLDYRHQKFEWVPALHTCLGGMILDEEAWTGVPGLWAAGECTSTIHGANRLSSCAYPDCYVFGMRAGRSAARHALRTDRLAPIGAPEVSREAEALRARFSTTGEKPTELIKRVRELAWNHMGLSRDDGGLRKALEEIEALKSAPVAVADAASLVKAVEFQNLVWSGEFVARAALERSESRGQHRRSDYPERNDERWRRWVVIDRGPDGPRVTISPIPSLGVEADGMAPVQA